MEGLSDASDWFAVGLDDLSDCLDDVSHRCVVENARRPRCQVELSFVDREDVFTLRDAIDGEPEVAGVERDAIRKLTSRDETGGRANDREDVTTTIEMLTRHDDDRMWTGRTEIGDKDFSRANHGVSSSRPAAFRTAVA